MKNLAIISLFISLGITGCRASDNKLQKQFNKICSSVALDNIPDKRMQVFEPVISIENGKKVLSGVTTNKKAKEQLIEALKTSNINIIDRMEILPSKTLEDKIYGVTSLSVINFRTKPGYDKESATQTLMGTPLRLLQQQDGWVRASTPEGYIAWVRESGISKMNKTEFEQYTAAKKVIVTSKYITIIKDINNHEAVSDAIWGNILLDKGSHGIYQRVSLADGREGFVKKSDIMRYEEWIAKCNPTPDNIIATAKEFMGIPYIWGGTSIKGVDCSGFTKSVFYLNGLILARDASQQCYTGENIDISEYVNAGSHTIEALKNLKTADLIFFGRKATKDKKERISHVGIYIGNGKFIHSAGFVHINSLIPNAPDYYEGSVNLVKAQRILGLQDIDKEIKSLQNSEYNRYF